MCQIAMRHDTGEEIGSIADLLRITGGLNAVTWSEGVDPKDAATLPHNNCLCWVDLPHTLIDAGFKVWKGDFAPEYWCEPVAPRPSSEESKERTADA